MTALIQEKEPERPPWFVLALKLICNVAPLSEKMAFDSVGAALAEPEAKTYTAWDEGVFKYEASVKEPLIK